MKQLFYTCTVHSDQEQELIDTDWAAKLWRDRACLKIISNQGIWAVKPLLTKIAVLFRTSTKESKAGLLLDVTNSPQNLHQFWFSYYWQRHTQKVIPDRLFNISFLCRIKPLFLLSSLTFFGLEIASIQPLRDAALQPSIASPTCWGGLRSVLGVSLNPPELSSGWWNEGNDAIYEEDRPSCCIFSEEPPVTYITYNIARLLQ